MYAVDSRPSCFVIYYPGCRRTHLIWHSFLQEQFCLQKLAFFWKKLKTEKVLIHFFANFSDTFFSRSNDGFLMFLSFTGRPKVSRKIRNQLEKNSFSRNQGWPSISRLSITALFVYHRQFAFVIYLFILETLWETKKAICLLSRISELCLWFLLSLFVPKNGRHRCIPFLKLPVARRPLEIRRKHFM